MRKKQGPKMPFLIEGKRTNGRTEERTGRTSCRVAFPQVEMVVVLLTYHGITNEKKSNDDKIKRGFDH